MFTAIQLIAAAFVAYWIVRFPEEMDAFLKFKEGALIGIGTWSFFILAGSMLGRMLAYVLWAGA